MRYDCEKQNEYDAQEEIRYKANVAESKVNVMERYLCCGMDKGSLIFLNLHNGKMTEVHSRLSISPKPITFVIEIG